MEVETTSIERSERFDMAIPIPRLRNHISNNQAWQSLSSLTNRRASISKPWKNIGLSQLNDVVCLGLVIGTPLTCVFFWMSLNYFNGSIFAAATEMHSIGFWTFWKTYFPKFDAEASLVYLLWVVFQALLYTFLPSEKSTGQLTAGGHLLEYRTNGLAAWIITVSAFVLGSLSGIISPSAIARHWEGMVLFLQMYGYILSVIVYIKGYWFPSYIEDCKFRGSAIYDFHMGIELNPRFGQSKNWDWKLFHNGRPGMILWTLIDLSFAAHQYETHGYITNSMVLANLFHALYVVDFFINEPWYLKTIDISHDHFGFYLAWGSAAFLPTMYTLQPQYLMKHPIQLSPLSLGMVSFLGIGGYALFRSVNLQKHRVRLANGNCQIWGKPAKVMYCNYETADGRKHTAPLLLSGWWGISRHCNYLGDLMMATAMCATCGGNDALPWFYLFFMTVILVHRCYRDEHRCRTKYGVQWEKYCSIVRWRILPGVW